MHAEHLRGGGPILEAEVQDSTKDGRLSEFQKTFVEPAVVRL